MENKEIEEILNYMKQYVENKYEHDSEPMLNYKDLQIVLSYIEQLEKENQQLKKQKADVVEYIKKYLHEHVIDDLPDEESKFETEGGIPIPNAKEILLRLLGEIDDNKRNDE